MSDFDTSKFLREGLKKINFSQIESAIKKDGVEGLISQKDNLINTLTEHATKTGFDYVDLGIETLTDSIATYLGATGQEGPAVGIVVLKDLAKIGFENFMKSTGIHRKKLQPGDYCAVLRGYQTFRELDKFIQDGREGLYLDKPTQKILKSPLSCHESTKTRSKYWISISEQKKIFRKWTAPLSQMLS